jgi:hypothetical protein
MQTHYVVQTYVDQNSFNECEIFWVLENERKVYERDYGSVGSGIAEYIEDYLEYIS